jgi:hypothetical protein
MRSGTVNKGLPFRAKTNSIFDFKLGRMCAEELRVWELKFQSDDEIDSIFMWKAEIGR